MHCPWHPETRECAGFGIWKTAAEPHRLPGPGVYTDVDPDASSGSKSMGGAGSAKQYRRTRVKEPHFNM